MTLGLGIFLSSLFLGTVFLFIATKDRWNWKKFILWPLGLLVTLSAGIYVYRLIEERPKVEKSYLDIPLKATKSEVLFIKGEPTKKDTDQWEYRTTDENGNWRTISRVQFADEQVWAVSYYSATEFDSHENIQGISIGDGVETVRAKFGAPSNASISKDGLHKIYAHNRYNVLFELAKNRVIGLGIYNPEVAKRGMRFADDKTD
jgi:hypothetical protein